MTTAPLGLFTVSTGQGTLLAASWPATLQPATVKATIAVCRGQHAAAAAASASWSCACSSLPERPRGVLRAAPPRRFRQRRRYRRGNYWDRRAVLSLIPLLDIFIGLPMGLVALVLGCVGLGKAGPAHVKRGMAVTGIVLGLLTIIFKLIPGVNLL